MSWLFIILELSSSVSFHDLINKWRINSTDKTISNMHLPTISYQFKLASGLHRLPMFRWAPSYSACVNGSLLNLALAGWFISITIALVYVVNLSTLSINLLKVYSLSHPPPHPNNPQQDIEDLLALHKSLICHKFVSWHFWFSFIALF